MRNEKLKEGWLKQHQKSKTNITNKNTIAVSEHNSDQIETVEKCLCVWCVGVMYLNFYL